LGGVGLIDLGHDQHGLVLVIVAAETDVLPERPAPISNSWRRCSRYRSISFVSELVVKNKAATEFAWLDFHSAFSS